MFETLSRHLTQVQSVLFPYLREEIGPGTELHMKVVTTLETIGMEQFIGLIAWPGEVGRPPRDRRPIARAFIAKAVLNLSTTRQLLDRLKIDVVLRRICGWEKRSDIPSESVFSRVFAEFSESELPGRIHAALITKVYEGEIVGHLSRDSTEIEAREKPVVKERKEPKQLHRKRGRPKKGEEAPPKAPTRIEKQQTMTVEEMLEDLPKECDVGCKRNSKGHQESWIGYKLHLDVADRGVPITAILTSASVHDSQAAIPMAMISQGRVTNLYDLMDAAYDVPAIRAQCAALGHVPLIDINTRRDTERKKELLDEKARLKRIGFETPESVRFRERTTVERANSRLKDEFGARSVRVRGHAKVSCHLMFGVLALAADQLSRIV